VQSQGFILTQLRYSEARLAEFYGHEQATRADGAWIVAPAPQLLPTLRLRLSADAAASLRIETPRGHVPIALATDAAHRLAITSCPAASDG
jgi:hypothetical protein